VDCAAAFALFVPGGGLVATLAADLSYQGCRCTCTDGRVAIIGRFGGGDFGEKELKGRHG
jgi:hypothetical protein